MLVLGLKAKFCSLRLGLAIGWPCDCALIVFGLGPGQLALALREGRGKGEELERRGWTEYRNRSSVNLGGKSFLPENYIRKINKMPRFSYIFPKN